MGLAIRQRVTPGRGFEGSRALTMGSIPAHVPYEQGGKIRIKKPANKFIKTFTYFQAILTLFKDFIKKL